MNQLTSIIAEAREITNKATPGEWKWTPDTSTNWETGEDTPIQDTGWLDGIIEYKGCGSHMAIVKEADKKHIAHFNPQFVQRLLNCLEKAVEQRNLYAGEDPIYFKNPSFESQESIDNQELTRILEGK